MRDVSVTLAAEHTVKTKEDKSALLEKEINTFSDYMEKLDNQWFRGPLIPQERALLKSYLVWKISGKDLS